MGEVVEDDGDREAEDPVTERDDRIDPGEAQQQFGGRRVSSDRGTLHEGRFPEEEQRRADHRYSYEDNVDVAEETPEPCRPRAPIDPPTGPHRLPHHVRSCA